MEQILNFSSFEEAEKMADQTIHSVAYLLGTSAGMFRDVMRRPDIAEETIKVLARRYERLREDNPDRVIATVQLRLHNLLGEYAVILGTVSIKAWDQEKTCLNAADEADGTAAYVSAIPTTAVDYPRMLVGFRVPADHAGAEEYVSLSGEFPAMEVSEGEPIPPNVVQCQPLLRGRASLIVKEAAGIRIPVVDRVRMISRGDPVIMGLLESNLAPMKEPEGGFACFSRCLSIRAALKEWERRKKDVAEGGGIRS